MLSYGGVTAKIEDTTGLRVHCSMRMTNSTISFRYILEISSLRTKGYKETSTVEHYLLFFKLFQYVHVYFSTSRQLASSKKQKPLRSNEALQKSRLKLKKDLLSLGYRRMQALAYASVNDLTAIYPF